MDTILILGSLPDTSEERGRYEDIIQICSEFATSVGSPIDTAEADVTPEKRYQKAFDSVTSADVMVAEMSEPSTGLGTELREAAVREIPIVVLPEEGSYVSGLVKGPMTVDVLRYDDSRQERFENRLEQL